MGVRGNPPSQKGNVALSFAVGTKNTTAVAAANGLNHDVVGQWGNLIFILHLKTLVFHIYSFWMRSKA